MSLICAYMCLYAPICPYIHVNIDLIHPILYECIHVCMCIYVHAYTCTYVLIDRICEYRFLLHIRICLCIYVCTHTYMLIRIRMCWLPAYVPYIYVHADHLYMCYTHTHMLVICIHMWIQVLSIPLDDKNTDDKKKKKKTKEKEWQRIGVEQAAGLPI